MRLIDAEELQTAVLTEDIMRDFWNDDYEACEAFMALIDNAPTIEVESIKHGHWINEHFTKEFDDSDIPVYRYAECSVCDKFVLFPYIYKYTIYDYCPYCGAKMDEVKE